MNMPSPQQVIFDGNCGFCKKWVTFFKYHAHIPFNFIPYQKLDPSLINIDPDKLESSIHVILNNRIISGGQALAFLCKHTSFLYWIYILHNYVPGFSYFLNKIYYMIANQCIYRCEVVLI